LPHPSAGGDALDREPVEAPLGEELDRSFENGLVALGAAGAPGPPSARVGVGGRHRRTSTASAPAAAGDGAGPRPFSACAASCASTSAWRARAGSQMNAITAPTNVTPAATSTP